MLQILVNNFSLNPSFFVFLHTKSTYMEVKTKALVLRALKYGDTQIIVDLLTETNGRMAIIQHLGQGRHARIRKQLFQPLTMLDVVIDQRPRARLHRLKDARLIFPYTSVPFDAAKLSMCMFVAEFLAQATRNEQRDVPLFQYVVASMRWLDECVRPVPNFHLVFMMRLSLFLGFHPNMEGEGPYFDLRAGCFAQQPPLHKDCLSADDSARLRLLMRMNYDNMHLFAMTRADRNRCVDVIMQYYQLHIPDMREMKSLAVLKELFG